MPIAILIGFEYTFNSLTGALIDLYHASKWCKSFNCDIHVLTDINFIKDIDNLQHVVDRRIADSDLLTFYDSIISKTIIRDGASLLMSIIKILQIGVPDNKVIIYYSGHGVKDSMVMPDRTLLPFIDFRNNILEILESYAELFWILDCCNPNGLHLPYKLDGNNFMLSPTKIECVSQPILLITSSEVNEKSIATKSGSVFSRHLFRLLSQLNNINLLKLPIVNSSRKKHVVIPNHTNRNLRRLIGNLSSSIRKMHTGYAQTVSIYSSYIIDPILWMWIGSLRNYDIVTDITLSILIIRNTTISKRTSSKEQTPLVPEIRLAKRLENSQQEKEEFFLAPSSKINIKPNSNHIKIFDPEQNNNTPKSSKSIKSLIQPINPLFKDTSNQKYRKVEDHKHLLSNRFVKESPITYENSSSKDEPKSPLRISSKHELLGESSMGKSPPINPYDLLYPE